MYLRAAQTPQKATALDELIKHNLQTATPLATRGKDASWERKASRRFPDTLRFGYCDNRASHRQVSQPELHCSPSPSPSHKARAEAEAVCEAPYRSSSGARTFLPAISQALTAGNRKEEASACHSPAASLAVGVTRQVSCGDEMGRLGVFEGLGFCHPSPPLPFPASFPPSFPPSPG